MPPPGRPPLAPGLSDALVADLEEIGLDEIVGPVDEGDGYYFYQLQDAGTRPLDEEDATLVRENAFFDWYDLLYFAAEDEGRISIDSPLGRVLLGRRVDDEVELRRPRGATSLVVVGIRYAEASS